MAWTDPAGHVWAVGEVLSAGNLNTYVRLNLTDLDRRTTSTAATVATGQGTVSTAYTNLATTGPAVTVTIGSTGLGIVEMHVSLNNAGATFQAFYSFAVSGATTVAAADANAPTMIWTAPTAAGGFQGGDSSQQSALVAGSNTFTAKYRSNSGANQANFSNRVLTVTPLGS